ncbi:hypothetical protein LCGC14_0615400 [marine sediment metagenome]|uniref:Uncharacterized protein n=1 Tax=marine sediment metagenome TaxID=412755 RepID=A0A0F9R6J8_9ZZZZ|nr:hypothetical protein [bacterium]
MSFFGLYDDESAERIFESRRKMERLRLRIYNIVERSSWDTAILFKRINDAKKKKQRTGE